jgi:hypothetical protein
MKLFQIPDQVRDEEWEEDGELNDGDGYKCGGCNWQADTVWLLAETLEDAVTEFRYNHRGLCGDCMCELISETEREVGNGL